MGGFFGAVSKRSVVFDVFFGTDYHSHLGTQNAGMAIWDGEGKCERIIHSIANDAFRAKFEEDLPSFSGNCGIGCISDSDPQPLVVRTKWGFIAVSTVGIINNSEELLQKHFIEKGQLLTSMSGNKINTTELVAALINKCDTIEEGIRNTQNLIDGSMTILVSTPKEIIAGRDLLGRIPVQVGKDQDGHCISFESFAYEKLGYTRAYELGPGEIVSINTEECKVLMPALEKMKICGFLWTYYGYPNSDYEGVNVELMRYKNGAIMAENELKEGTLPEVDYIAGVPDSGVPHAIGYANKTEKHFARPFVKYTPTWPRSFMPENQEVRNRIAKMKQIPVSELIEGKKLLMVDDSIVRGTQLKETVDFLYESGAEEVHMRSASPPIMYVCKYLNFSRGNSDMDLLARKVIQELEGEEGQKHIDEYGDPSTKRGKCLLHSICEKFGFNSLGYQTLDGLLEAIGLDKESICTYCWTGKE